MYYINTFFLYSLLGFVLENTLFKNTNPTRVSGVLMGPITLVYGLGAVVIMLINKYLIPKIKTKKILKIIISFLIYSVALALVEALSGYLCKIIFQTEMWNYSNKKYHIGKYTCLEWIPIWGILALVITNIIKPFIDKIISLIPKEATYFFILLLSLDVIITLITK